MKLGSLGWKMSWSLDLDSEKVMHTQKWHSELYHELNQKFHIFDHYHGPSMAKREKQWTVALGRMAQWSVSSEKISPRKHLSLSQQWWQQSWSTFKFMTLGLLPPKSRERLALLLAAGWEPAEPSYSDF